MDRLALNDGAFDSIFSHKYHQFFSFDFSRSKPIFSSFKFRTTTRFTEQVRLHFQNDARAKAILEDVRSFKVTR
jgi:hypothetical protein